MSLKNILLDVSSVLALDITSVEEKAYHVQKINEAAEELYNGNNLPGCLREQLFQVDDSLSYQFSFPWYVDKIRAMRFYNNWLPNIPIESMKPRYHNNKWGNKGLIRGRIKALGQPLRRDLQDISPLIFTHSDTQGEATNVVYNVIGATELSDRVYEAVTILANTQSATSVNNYKSVEKIEKTDYNTLDCTVTNLNGDILSVIPNSLLKPSYTIVHTRDDDYAPYMGGSYPLNTLEVLYKTKFVPFKELYDEFPCPNCDKLIFWKFLENYFAYKPGMTEKLAVAVAKGRELLQQLFDNDSLGMELLLEFGPNAMLEAYETTSLYPGEFGPPIPFNVYTPS